MKATTGIQVSWVNNPLDNEKTIDRFERGVTLKDILSNCYPNEHIYPYLSITVDGKGVDYRDSLFVIPESNVFIEIHPEWSTWWGSLIINLAISAVVGYISYRYMKSKMGDGFGQGDEVDSIRSQRNQAKKYEPVPIILGRRRVVPQLAAQPWTEARGRDQYINILLSVGHVPLKIEDLRIGDTPFANFGDDIEYQIYDAYQNFDDLTLFPNDVFEEAIDFEFRTLGQSETRTTAVDTDEISVELYLPAGLWRQGDGGSTSGTNLEFIIEYRETGTGSWTLGYDSNGLPGGTRKDAFYVTENFNVPRGQYDVRVTLQDRNQSDNRHNDLRWSTLKSIRKSTPVVTDASALIACRIRASERASGNLDRINCIATSVVPNDWNIDWSSWRPTGTTGSQDGQFETPQGQYRKIFSSYVSSFRDAFQGFGLTPSENPGELYRWMVQGPFIKQKVTDGKIDLAALGDFRDYCTNKGWTISAEIEQERTLGETLNSICDTAQAEMTVRQGQYSVTIDEPKTEYSCVFTFKNSSDLTFAREFLEPIDGYRVEFDNKDLGYEKDEILVGYEGQTSTQGNFERLNLWGVSDYNQAYERARHKLADRNLRQEVYSFTSNVQGADSTRGDLVLIQMPTIGVGVASGWVRSIDGNDIVVDERCATEAGEDYGVLIIKSDNTVFYEDVTGVTNGTTLTLASTTGIEVGDRFSFGVRDNEARECIIQELKPNNDLTFEITAVNYAPEIFNIDGQSIPQYDPVFDLPAESDRLPSPTLRYVRVFRDREQTETGVWRVNITVGYSYSTTYGLNAFDLQLQYRRQGEVVWQDAGTQDAGTGEFTIQSVDDRTVYEFRMRTRQGGDSSDWVNFEQFVESNAVEDPPLPKVNGLQLYGTKGNEFSGNDIKLVWRPTSLTRNYELGQEPSGGDDGGYDPYFKDYLVEVVDPDAGDIIRETYVKDPEYNYTFEKNLEDGGPRREVRFRVYLRGSNNQISQQAAKIRVFNPQPELHTGFSVSPRFSGVEVQWNSPTDNDFKATQIHISQTSGFAPDETTLEYEGPDTRAQITGLQPDQTYYLKYLVYDSFGPELANVSSEFEFTTLTATEEFNLGSWAEVDIGTRDQIEEWLKGEADHHETTFFPKIAAGQIVSGVIQATELIESEGLIRAVDDINSPSFETVFGPQLVDGTTYLIHAKPSNTTNITFGFDEFGNLIANNAQLNGTVSAGGLVVDPLGSIRSGKQNFGDDTPGFFLGAEGQQPVVNIGEDDDFFKYSSVGVELCVKTELRGTDAYSNQSIYEAGWFDIGRSEYQSIESGSVSSSQQNADSTLTTITSSDLTLTGTTIVRQKEKPLRVNRTDALLNTVNFKGTANLEVQGSLPTNDFFEAYVGYGGFTIQNGSLFEVLGSYVRVEQRDFNGRTTTFTAAFPDSVTESFRTQEIGQVTDYNGGDILVEMSSTPTGQANELEYVFHVSYVDTAGITKQIDTTFTFEVTSSIRRIIHIPQAAMITDGTGNSNNIVNFAVGEWKFLQERAEFGLGLEPMTIQQMVLV